MRKEQEIQHQKIEEEKERIRVSDPSKSRWKWALGIQRQIQKENEVAAIKKQYERDLRNIQVSVNHRRPAIRLADPVP